MTQSPLRFFYNGIKVGKGSLQKAHFSLGNLRNHAENTITIYAREYTRFSAEIREAFKVENDTDTMTDYFEHDRIRVEPSHPLYAQVKAAFDKQENRLKAKAAA